MALLSVDLTREYSNEPYAQRRNESRGLPKSNLTTADTIRSINLKGLFDVLKAISRSPPVIRSDVIRMVQEKEVGFSEVPDGFPSRLEPSLEIKEVNPHKLIVTHL